MTSHRHPATTADAPREPSLRTTPRTSLRPGRRAGGLALGLALAGSVAAALAALGPALPAVAAAPRARTTLDVHWGDTTPVAGQKVLLYGFAFPGTANRELKLQTRATASSAWTTVGRVRTVSNGSFTVYLQHTIAGSHSYRFLAAATTTALESTTRTVAVTVARRSTTTTAALSATTATRLGGVSVTGTVGPDFTARRVLVQTRRTGTSAWVTRSTLTLNESRRYSAPVPTTTTGSWQVRAVAAGTTYAASDASPTLSLRVTAG